MLFLDVMPCNVVAGYKRYREHMLPPSSGKDILTDNSFLESDPMLDGWRLTSLFKNTVSVLEAEMTDLGEAQVI